MSQNWVYRSKIRWILIIKVESVALRLRFNCVKGTFDIWLQRFHFFSHDLSLVTLLRELFRKFYSTDTHERSATQMMLRSWDHGQICLITNVIEPCTALYVSSQSVPSAGAMQRAWYASCLTLIFLYGTCQLLNTESCADGRFNIRQLELYSRHPDWHP